MMIFGLNFSWKICIFKIGVNDTMLFVLNLLNLGRLGFSFRPSLSNHWLLLRVKHIYKPFFLEISIEYTSFSFIVKSCFGRNGSFPYAGRQFFLYIWQIVYQIGTHSTMYDISKMCAKARLGTDPPTFRFFIPSGFWNSGF